MKEEVEERGSCRRQESIPTCRRLRRRKGGTGLRVAGDSASMIFSWKRRRRRREERRIARRHTRIERRRGKGIGDAKQRTIETSGSPAQSMLRAKLNASKKKKKVRSHGYGERRGESSCWKRT